jgi:hypothetical protein
MEPIELIIPVIGAFYRMEANKEEIFKKNPYKGLLYYQS